MVPFVLQYGIWRPHLSTALFGFAHMPDQSLPDQNAVQKGLDDILGAFSELADFIKTDDGWREAFQVKSDLYRNQFSLKDNQPVYRHDEQWAIVHRHKDGLPCLEKIHHCLPQNEPDLIEGFASYVRLIDPVAEVISIGRVQSYTGILGFTQNCNMSEKLSRHTQTNPQYQVISEEEAHRRFQAFLNSSPDADASHAALQSDGNVAAFNQVIGKVRPGWTL